MHYGIPFASLFDILGLFLSSISLAPSSSTTRNFYLPLTAMYAKWCITLGNCTPTMLNCTWAVAGQARDRFFLGASLKGYNAPSSIGPWAWVVKEARFFLINDEEITEGGYAMSNCQEKGITGRWISFGNRAETYSFLHILK